RPQETARTIAALLAGSGAMLGSWFSDVRHDIGHGVIDAEVAGVLALVALIAILVVLHLVLRTAQGPLPSGDTPEGTVARRRSGIKSLVIGTDGRASTSKWQAVLWTFAVVYVFAFMLVWGRSNADCPTTNSSHACVEARDGRKAFNNLINT